jgi:hypothetical protein
MHRDSKSSKIERLLSPEARLNKYSLAIENVFGSGSKVVL